MHENLQQLFLSPQQENKLLALQLCKSAGLEEEFKYYRYVFYLFGICSHAEFEFSAAEKWIERLSTYHLEPEYSSTTTIKTTEQFLYTIYDETIKALNIKDLTQGNPVFDWYEFLNAFMEITLLGASYVFKIQAENKVSLPILHKSIAAWAEADSSAGRIKKGVLSDLKTNWHLSNFRFTLRYFCDKISLEGLKILATSNIKGCLDFLEVEILEIPIEFAQAAQIYRIFFSVSPDYQAIKGLEYLRHIKVLELCMLPSSTQKEWKMGDEWAVFDNLELLVVGGLGARLRLASLSKNIILNCKKPEKFGLLLNLPQNARLPKNMEYFAGIRSLILYSFKFKKIPRLLEKFKNLEELKLSSSRMRILPDWLFNFPALKSLSISGFYLHKIPAHISKLQHLEVFCADFNYLEELPNELAQLKKLEYLSIKNNNFKKLPPVLKELHKVRFLVIQNNFLTSWEDLENLPMPCIELKDCFKNAELMNAFRQKLAQNPDPRFRF